MGDGERCAGGELTPLAVLVLGLAVERPMHPYEMFQTLTERREDRFAKLRLGSLYHTVDRLHSQNLLRVNGVHRDGNRPERTVYAATDEGAAVLRSNLAAMLRTPVTEYPRLYLALAEAHALGRDEVVELLDTRLTAMRSELEEISMEVSTSTARGIPEMFLLDAGCRRAALDAQIDWIVRLRERLATGELMWLEEWHAQQDGAQDDTEPTDRGRSARSQNEVDS